MKIINWNVGRPTIAKGEKILQKLKELNGDIVILTETNASINLGTDYQLVSTPALPDGHDTFKYSVAKKENRSSIWSKYPILRTYPTCDEFTSVCADIETPFGVLTVYATIIGVDGGNKMFFNRDLNGQLSDFERLFPEKQVCLVGDFNITFTGRRYPSELTREKMNDMFETYSLNNLTSSIDGCVDHIALGKEFLIAKHVKNGEVWNEDKSISDHFGVSISITV